MDQLRAIRVLLKVVENGSLAGAARELDAAAAGVTRLVADLERHVGVRLLNRTTRRIALTDAGERYVDRVRSLVAELDDADETARSANGVPRGHVRVRVTPAFATHQLARHLPAFQASHPEVSVELVVTDAVAAVDEACDVSIVMTGLRELSGDFVASPLACSELVLCASPAYLDRRGRPGTPADLERLDALMPPIATARREVTFHRMPSAAGPGTTLSVRPRRPVLASMHVETMHAAALAGIGIVGLPSFVAEGALRTGTLERVLRDWHVLTLSVYAGMPTRRHVPARTRAFREFLLRQYGGRPREDPWLASLGEPAPGLQLGSPGPGFVLQRVPS